MSRVTTPLLALGPAKLARRNLICVQSSPLDHEVFVIAASVCGLGGKIWVTSM